uniref:LRRCT domain-containing protein n=1 Tax=Megaselia scalaris TaxID=36166 RepID=T1GCI4_MEGSC
MRISWSVFILLFAVIYTVNGEENKTTEAPKTTAVPKHPAVKTLQSALCKKCKCDKYKLLLDCSRLQLTEWFKTDEIDTLVYGNIKFETIDLSFNNLTKVPAFPKLSVKNVLLNFNKIEEIANAAFQNLTHLTKLDLSNNQLNNSKLVPEIFEGNYSPSEYEPLEFLRELNLANNDLHKLREDIFEHCDNLEFLDLSYMQLSKLPGEILHGSGNLETVVLTGNLFKLIPDEALSNTVKLKSLNMDENPIDEVGGDNVFPKLEKLEYLSLSYMNDLKTIGVGAFKNLPNLKTLQVTHNPALTTFSVEAFASYDKKNSSIVTYPTLENLYLDGNNLKKLDEKILNKWESIQQISLSNNPWDCDDHNTWFISNLVPYIHNSLSVPMARNIKCASPTEMRDKEVYEIHVQNREAELQQGGGGGSVVLGIFIGIIVGVPMTFGILLILRKYRNNSSSSTVNYNRAKFESNFDI